MRKFVVTSALLLLAAAPASGQQFQLRSYYGCGIWSCHTLEYLLHPRDDLGPNFFVSAQSLFFAPAGLGGFLPLFSDRVFPEYLSGNVSYLDYGITDYFRLPRHVDLYVSYGRVGYEWPQGEGANETIRLTGTVPEPAALLLLLTGLAGFGGAARRRRRTRT